MPSSPTCFAPWASGERNALKPYSPREERGGVGGEHEEYLSRLAQETPGMGSELIQFHLHTKISGSKRVCGGLRRPPAAGNRIRIKTTVYER